MQKKKIYIKKWDNTVQIRNKGTDGIIFFHAKNQKKGKSEAMNVNENKRGSKKWEMGDLN